MIEVTLSLTNKWKIIEIERNKMMSSSTQECMSIDQWWQLAREWWLNKRWFFNTTLIICFIQMIKSTFWQYFINIMVVSSYDK